MDRRRLPQSRVVRTLELGELVVTNVVTEIEVRPKKTRLISLRNFGCALTAFGKLLTDPLRQKGAPLIYDALCGGARNKEYRNETDRNRWRNDYPRNP
jgi:hypothetical protein